MAVKTGLDILLGDSKFQDSIKGQVAYLCHNASVTSSLEHGLFGLKKIFGKRLERLFGPQHGFQTDVQDNMIESDHFVHPYFGLKIFSLYSETRVPTDQMLEGLDTIIIDLQDVGTRIYTYIYTMCFLMEKCGPKNIKVVVLDRPNPLGGQIIEGNILQKDFTSFVGAYPLPTRHALTIGEVATMAVQSFGIDCELEVIHMKDWKRSLLFPETKLPWVLPSPNMPVFESSFPFVGTVMFEGTNISEGRGTTRPLELIGHPACEPYSFLDLIKKEIPAIVLEGCVLRPTNFLPTFQKHQGQVCGGYQIHVTNAQTFKPWALCQHLCRLFYHHLPFEWKSPPYEYEYDRMPIDLINGTDQLRLWVEKNGDQKELETIEKRGLDEYQQKWQKALLYS